MPSKINISGNNVLSVAEKEKINKNKPIKTMNLVFAAI